ncbi:hypothetical protein LJR220_002097 [Bradyrhizobium sp. LjRoot220]|uniref:hypothetical protein n=1 Tax=Bradyrhizobium sp. LjRoot220 TaxID=3342284 RepID=UPI003ECEAF20
MLSRAITLSVITLATAVASIASVSVAQAGMVGNSNFGGSRTGMAGHSNFAGSKPGMVGNSSFAGSKTGMVGNSSFDGKTVIHHPIPTPPRVQTPTPKPMIKSNIKLHCHKYVDRTTNPGHPVMATTCH